MDAMTPQETQLRNFMEQCRPSEQDLIPMIDVETHLLSGYPGESVVMARRKGSVWYVAGINGTDEVRTLDFSRLSRYVKKTSNVKLFLDSDGKRNTPWAIINAGRFDQRGMKTECQPRGGFVIVCK